MKREEKDVLAKMVGISSFLIAIVILIAMIFISNDCPFGSDGNDDRKPSDNIEKIYSFDLRVYNETPNLVHLQFEGFETSYSWNGTHMIDYGDGNSSGWVTTKTLVHRYEILQEYTLKLFATPQNNSFKFVAKRIIDLSEVGSMRPIAVIKDSNPSYYMNEQPVMLSGDSSYDIDGEVIGYYWDFGDRSHSDLSTGIRDGFQPTKVTSHIYDSPGDYFVKLWVIDNDFYKCEEPEEIRVRILAQSCVY